MGKIIDLRERLKLSGDRRIADSDELGAKVRSIAEHPRYGVDRIGESLERELLLAMPDLPSLVVRGKLGTIASLISRFGKRYPWLSDYVMGLVMESQKDYAGAVEHFVDAVYSANKECAKDCHAYYHYLTDRLNSAKMMADWLRSDGLIF